MTFDFSPFSPDLRRQLESAKITPGEWVEEIEQCKRYIYALNERGIASNGETRQMIYRLQIELEKRIKAVKK